MIWKRKKSAGSFLVFLFIVSTVPSGVSSAFVFSRNVRLGDRSEDVKELQRILNTSPDTQVALLGAGSPGNETDYFGQQTLKAVMNFQNKHRADVLIPAGLSSATGFVGTLTRQKINTLSSRVVSPLPVSVAPPSSSQMLTRLEAPSSFPSSLTIEQVAELTLKSYESPLRLYSAMPYQTLPQSEVILSGTSFAASNTVHFGESVSVSEVKSNDGSTLKITLPASAVPGKYEVWVTNEKGSSRRSEFPVYVLVSTTPQASPSITEVTPSETVTFDDEIQVRGSGFIEKNTILTGFGLLENISPRNADTLVFKVSDLQASAAMRKIVSARPGTIMRLSFYVMNENGISQSKDIFVK